MEGFTSAELGFEAEDETISIVPKQKLPSLNMAGWKSPLLRPLRRADVPLWFAVLLKRQDRCSIVWPDWLDLDLLTKVADKERREPQFAELPWFWQPLNAILLREASDDYEGDVAELMQTLQTLKELRVAKVRAGVLMANPSHLEMTNLGAAELNEVRAVLGRTMRTLQHIEDNLKDEPASVLSK